MLQFLNSILVIFNIHIFESSSQKELRTPRDELIIWNVGQGQWATVSTSKTCLHFDIGGERVNWSPILALCKPKKNLAFFSHWDMDHLSFVSSAFRQFENFCVSALPSGPCPSEKKLKIFSNLPRCSIERPKEVIEIFESRSLNLQKLSSNDYSRVFEYSNWMLAQGDSPIRQEKHWTENSALLEKIKVIVLGHHGSRTSTSDLLLSRLPNLKIAIASARKARYGHPHEEVLKRLKKFGVSSILTEEWGNIHIELP